MILTDEEIAYLLHHPYFEKMWTEIEGHIKQLENRIIQLEVQLSKKRLVMDDDSWYWDH